MRKVYLTIVGLFLMFAFSASFMKFTVKAEAQQGTETVSVTVTSYFNDSNHPQTVISDQNYGTVMSLDSSLASEANYAFAFWVVDGVIYKDLPVDHQFTLLHNMSITAVFYPTSPLQYAVLFMDTNGEQLDLQYVSSGASATPPSSGLPDKPGYVVSPTTPWSVDTSNVTGNTVSVLQYDLNTASSYTVSVLYGTINGAPSDTVEYNGVATVVANTPGSGLYFHHWEIEDKTVSYQSTYSFTVLQNTNLTAVYSATPPSDVPMITLSDNLGLRSGKHSYVGQFYLPTGYEFVEVGVLSSANTDFLDLDASSTTRNKVETYNGATKEFLITLDEASSASVRAYLIYKHSGTLYTVYDMPAYSVLNGGFETGDTSGWNRFDIWKGETGMQAMTDDRIVSGTYFGGNYPYGRDGTYNLGVYGGSQTWDQSSERMGYLRSSNFVLGGSGWISFKLGGGQTTSTAYVSVRRTTDNVEVARFGNPIFSDFDNRNAIASAQYGDTITNAEAFLFQYYFDLSSVGTLGEQYYITLTEASSFNWDILSADSFITYYPVAPTPGANQTATNIVPNINGTGSATNSIPDSGFDNGFTYWQNVDGTWKIESGQAKSNATSDDDMGVIRSAAFTINGDYQCLRWDWAGGQKYDKQVFMSVKEVGTNIEVMRFVRRDNLSSKAAGNYDNHMADLRSLDTSKEYYLEFVDNVTSGQGSYAVNWVDNVRLVTYSEYSGITSGDIAFPILRGYSPDIPLEATFIYVKNY